MTEPPGLIRADIQAFQSGATTAGAGSGMRDPASDIQLTGMAANAQIPRGQAGQENL